MCTEESAASAASSEAQRAAAHQLQVVEHEPGAALQRLLHLSIHRLVQLRACCQVGVGCERVRRVGHCLNR